MGEYFSLIWQKQVSTNQGRIIFFPQTKYCVNLRTRKEIGNNFKNYTFQLLAVVSTRSSIHENVFITSVLSMTWLAGVIPKYTGKIIIDTTYLQNNAHRLTINDPVSTVCPANSIRMMNFYQTRNLSLINRPPTGFN